MTAPPNCVPNFWVFHILSYLIPDFRFPYFYIYQPRSGLRMVVKGAMKSQGQVEMAKSRRKWKPVVLKQAKQAGNQEAGDEDDYGEMQRAGERAAEHRWRKPVTLPEVKWLSRPDPDDKRKVS